MQTFIKKLDIKTQNTILNYFTIKYFQAAKKLPRVKKSCFKKSETLDQFYTNPIIADMYYDKLNTILLDNNLKIDDFDIELEPSAGDGSFFKLMNKKKRCGLDLEPKLQGIIKQDFFNYIPPSNKKIITIGNPPFGKNASLAVKFFNKAAQFSDIIAFIVPKTFKKHSLTNRLDLNFKLLFQEDLPYKSFIFNNEPYDVPCCFQIWQKTKKKRTIKKVSLENDVFEFVNKDSADLAIRRVGGTTGKVKANLQEAAEVSHHFIRLKNNLISKSKLTDFINNLSVSEIINSTAGVRSLSKQEFVEIFFKSFKLNNVI